MQEEKPAGVSTDPTSPDRSAEARARETVSLMAQLQAGSAKSIKNKVMQVLSQRPETRDNDVLLTITLYKRFYPELVADGRVSLEDLFRLPTQFEIQRLRAHIQNTLGLFLASPGVRDRRLRNQKSKFKEFARSSGEEPPGLVLKMSVDQRLQSGDTALVTALQHLGVGSEPAFDPASVRAALELEGPLTLSGDNAERSLQFVQILLAQAEPWLLQAITCKATAGVEEAAWEGLQLLILDAVAREVARHDEVPHLHVQIGRRSLSGTDVRRCARLEEDLLEILGQAPETEHVSLKLRAVREPQIDAGLEAAALVAEALLEEMAGEAPADSQGPALLSRLREEEQRLILRSLNSARKHADPLALHLAQQLRKISSRRAVQLPLLTAP